MNKTWILSRTEEPLVADLDEVCCREFTAIAAGSPANELGLDVGDFIVDIDTLEATKIDLAEYVLRDEEPIHYTFVQPEKKNVIYAELAAIPLGALTESSAKGIVNRCQREGFSDWGELEILWRRRQWQELYDASVALINFNLGDRFKRIFNKRHGLSADEMFKGVALYEMGQEEDGIELIANFINNDISNHVQSVSAIAFFYSAKWAKLCGDQERYEYWLEHANYNNGGLYDRITQEVAILNNIEPIVRYRWLNKLFPVDYNLPSIFSKKYIGLGQTLESMQSNQLLPVCVMPSYRGNGPYNTAIQAYRGIYRILNDNILPMQVITDTLEKRSDRQWWYYNEEQAHETGVPIDVLFDENGYVSNVLDNNTTPTFYLVDKERNIHYEGFLDDAYYYWQSLNQCK